MTQCENRYVCTSRKSWCTCTLARRRSSGLGSAMARSERREDERCTSLLSSGAMPTYSVMDDRFTGLPRPSRSSASCLNTALTAGP